jgi:hypothetical protein
MSKSKVRDFEHPLAEQEKSSKSGIFATIAILSVVGLVLWFFLSDHESS